MPNFDVEFFEKSDGTFPAEEFILSQDVKMQAKLFRLLELLEVNGNNLREPYSKSLDDGIFEIRAKQGNNITNGFTKKTQKTPPGEIELSKKYRSEYEQRKENL